MAIPGGVIFINTDLVDQVRDTIAKQLYITNIMTGAEYDALIASDADYPTYASNNNIRLMVIRPLNDYTNRETAHVVLFFSHGVIAVEKNKFGPPNLRFRAAEIHWGKLCVYGIPQDNSRCPYG